MGALDPRLFSRLQTDRGGRGVSAIKLALVEAFAGAAVTLDTLNARYSDADMRLAMSRAVAIEAPRGWRIAKDKKTTEIDVVVVLAMAAHHPAAEVVNPAAWAIACETTFWLARIRRRRAHGHHCA
jgi:hypothetical protein